MEYNKKELLRGIIDIHIHSGPSVAPRSVDAVGMLRIAEEAEYKAIVIKDHYFPTMPVAEMIDKHFKNGDTRVFGGICLNNAIGAFNLNAIDTACAMGAKFVWMPTLSAKQHIDTHRGRFVGAGNLQIPEEPLYYLDEQEDLHPEVVEVLNLIAEHPGVVLGTGHASVKELDRLIPKAFELGISRLIINHPYFIVNASIDDVVRWANMGAYVELNGALFEGVTGSIKSPNIPMDLAIAYIEKIPIDRIIIASDSGQKGSILPDEVMFRFMCLLMDRGVSRSNIDMMTKITPAKLISI